MEQVHMSECQGSHTLWRQQGSIPERKGVNSMSYMYYIAYIKLWVEIRCFKYHKKGEGVFVVCWPSREFFTYRDGFKLRPMLGAHGHIEHWVFFSVPDLQLWHGTSDWWFVWKTCDIKTCCWTFGSGTVTIFFNDVGLSQSEFKPRLPACGANGLPLTPYWCPEQEN